jgi:hypothetical protein
MILRIILILMSVQFLQALDHPEIDTYIAQRANGGRVLIFANIPFGPEDESNPRGPLEFSGAEPPGATLLPSEIGIEMSPSFLQNWKKKLSPEFAVGALWHVYPGEGPPIRIIIEKLLYVYRDVDDCIAAVGRPVGRKISGLKAREYLAIPGKIDKSISNTRMVELKTPLPNVLAVLTEKAKSIVDGEDWELSLPAAETEELAHARRINQLFRAQLGVGQPEFRMWRWAADGAAPFIFVEVVWWDRSSHSALFAADVILEQGKDLRIISFDYQKAQMMRIPVFIDRRRDFSINREMPAFRNAWKIGKQPYVLMFADTLESSDLTLHRINREGGLVVILGVESLARII